MSKIELQYYTCPETRLNCYLLGHSQGIYLIDLPEISNEYYDLLINFSENIRGIFITHQNPTNVHSLTTIRKIFSEIPVYSSHNIPKVQWKVLNDGDTFNFFSKHWQIISVPGHHLDSIILKIENCLFTGDILTAGKIADSDGGINRAILIDFIKENILTMDQSTRILPSIGPITSVHAELNMNLDLLLPSAGDFSKFL